MLTRSRATRLVEVPNCILNIRLRKYFTLKYFACLIFVGKSHVNICSQEYMHENSVGLSSTTNPKPKGQPSISLPAQANLTQQKAEPLRCLALRTRGGRLKSSFACTVNLEILVVKIFS